MRLLLVPLLLVCALALPRTALADGDARLAVAEILRGQDVRLQVSRIQYAKQERAGARLLSGYVRHRSGAVRRNVALALSFLAGPAQLAELKLLAGDVDGAVRMGAATGLGRAGPQAAEALIPLLEDPTHGVRREAARSLGAVGTPREGAAVARLLTSDEELEVRVAAMIALGQMKATRQKGLLLERLRSDSRATREAAARGLVLMGDAEGFRYVRDRLASHDVHERLGGLELLEGISLAALAPIANPLLEDDEHRLRASAALHLARAGERRARLWLILAAHDARVEERAPYSRALEALLVTEAESNEVLRRTGRLR